MRPIRLLKSGDRFIRAADINEIIMELARQGKFYVDGEGAELDSGGSGVRLSVPKAERGIWAKITSGSNPYAWTEQDVGTGGTFSNKTNGRSGTTTQDPAYEINDNTMVAANSIVWMERAYVNISGSTVSQEWTFSLASGGATGLTVEEVDGTPSFTNITKILFDQGDLFSLTQPSANQVRVRQLFSGVRLTCSADPIAAGATLEPVVWGTEIYDTDSYWASSPNPSRIAIEANVYYHVSGSLSFSVETAAYHASVQIRDSDTALLTTAAMHVEASGTEPNTTSVNFSVDFKAPAGGGDFIEAQVSNNSGTAIDVTGEITMHRLGQA